MQGYTRGLHFLTKVDPHLKFRCRNCRVPDLFIDKPEYLPDTLLDKVNVSLRQRLEQGVHFMSDLTDIGLLVAGLEKQVG